MRTVQPTQNIHVATDFSQASELAVRAAPLLAQQNDARVTLVHVLDVQPLDEGAVQQGGASQQELEAAVHQHLDRLRTDMMGDTKDVKTVMLRGRNAADSLCQFAEDDDADLIVIATHGRAGLSRFLIGSVAEKVVRHAPCPVLVLRSKSAR